MIWLGIAILTILALLPALLLPGGALRDRRDAALALHRAQLAELARDRADGRLPASEHATAMLEVQRRLLAADLVKDPPSIRAHGGLLGLTLILVPMAALGLYLIGGSPALPAAPLHARLERAADETRQMQRLATELQQRIAHLPPGSDAAWQGLVLLGGLHARMGAMRDAAKAWTQALAIRFEPALAMETAEATLEATGHPTPESTGLFRKALDAAPPNAPWRTMVQKRLEQAR